MHNADSSFLFDDIDFVLPSRCAEKRAAMLRQVTYLFLSEAGRLSEKQICVFDDVLVQLIERLPSGSIVKAGHDRPKRDFTRYSKPNAQRLLRYWQIGEASAGSA